MPNTRSDRSAETRDFLVDLLGFGSPPRALWGENFQRNLDLVERVKEIAAEKAIAPGQLALAWVMAQGDDVVPIPRTKRRRYLEANIAAAKIELSDVELARIDEVAPIGATVGNRFDEAGMTAVQQ